MSELGLLPSVALFAKASSPGAHSYPSVLLSFVLKSVEVVP